mgnify:CR=1 FL=1
MYAHEMKNSTTVGLTGPTAAGAAPLFSSDLDIPFRQTSFDQARLINFGTQGAGVSGGASLGFAILSDIEAYFFMNAVQSDIRTNVLQAPKVTLFNGQQAFVSDTSMSPFVISVIPVVGDFADAQQPVQEIAEGQPARGRVVAGAALEHRIDGSAEIGAEHQRESRIGRDHALACERHDHQHYGHARMGRPGESGRQQHVEHRLGFGHIEDNQPDHQHERRNVSRHRLHHPPHQSEREARRSTLCSCAQSRRR